MDEIVVIFQDQSWDIFFGGNCEKILRTQSMRSFGLERKFISFILSEKALIFMSDHKFPLNKRSELLSKCRHREKFLLS